MTGAAEKSRLTDRPNKRRAGADAGGLAVADSRPRVIGGFLIGARCTDCRHPLSQLEVPWCPVCFGRVEQCGFAPVGTVWAATTVRIPVGRWRAPFGLAYVDVLDGPRVLVHVRCEPTPSAGDKIAFDLSESGDLVQIDLEQEVAS
ncbi:OB-fold domain-containing protein [Nocardia sp. CA2R105]|uniref:OB-fold domain-containing protein n=1 Tax=Nocardia coffeae TaxID=2873381 RepID=UPI001CA739E5|nr:OB-fold domain-containing protein [Nocardia coffeae]MBY8857252.1 OB-fold domain-containing protein [Nocardia coffeae]